MVSLGQKFNKDKKHAKNPSTRTLELFCAKKALEKKNQIFDKSDNFKKRPSSKSYSTYKGYSPSKMVSLGQKLTNAKTCEKPFYRNI